MAVRETQTGEVAVVTPDTQKVRETQTGLVAVTTPNTAKVRESQTGLVAVVRPAPRVLMTQTALVAVMPYPVAATRVPVQIFYIS